MSIELEFFFRATAFKHHLTEADIRHAFDTARYVSQYGNRENVYLLLGFDRNANPVEILYNEIEIGKIGINVFHAMPCRSYFLPLYEGEVL